MDRDQFERVQSLITNNAQGTGGSGAAKHGMSLLAGLLRCRRCGRKLVVKYTGNKHQFLRYSCTRGYLDNAESKCIDFGGIPVDDAVSAEILRVVQPASVQAALNAEKDHLTKHSEVVRLLETELQAARYGSDRAWKQYDSADPENRLVADELERRWNVALLKVRELEARIARENSVGQSHPINELDLSTLATDLNELWHDPKTDAGLKKRIARALIEEVIADTDSSAGEVIVVVHWKGGVHTEMKLHRRRRGESSKLHTSVEAVQAVTELVTICSDDVIAGYLNRNGLRTGVGNRWTRERVTALRSKRKIPIFSQARKQEHGWMNMTEAATYLGISAVALRRALKDGRIKAKHPLTDGPWIFERSHLDEPVVQSSVAEIKSYRQTTTEASLDQLRLSEINNIP